MVNLPYPVQEETLPDLLAGAPMGGAYRPGETQTPGFFILYCSSGVSSLPEKAEHLLPGTHHPHRSPRLPIPLAMTSLRSEG